MPEQFPIIFSPHYGTHHCTNPVFPSLTPICALTPSPFPHLAYVLPPARHEAPSPRDLCLGMCTSAGNKKHMQTEYGLYNQKRN
jgi:hypothetical protein